MLIFYILLKSTNILSSFLRTFFCLALKKQIGDYFLKMGCFLENSNDSSQKHTHCVTCMFALNESDHDESQ